MLQKTLASKADNNTISYSFSLVRRQRICNMESEVLLKTRNRFISSSADIGLDGSFIGVEEWSWLCVRIAAGKNCSGTQEYFHDVLKEKKYQISESSH